MNSDFKELLEALNEAEVEYLVIGGYAVIHYSQPRYTKDIDIWLNPTEENSYKVLAAFEAFGLPLLSATRADFANEGLMYYIGVEPCRIDFLTTVPGVDFTAAWAARVVSDDDGLEIRYISKADLITAKEVAARPQDLVDVSELRKLS